MKAARTSGAPVVVLVGDSANDNERLHNLMTSGAVVVVASSIEEAEPWLESQGLSVQPPTAVSAGRLELDLSQHRARWDGVNLSVTELELRILAVLAREHGRVCSFAELQTNAWLSPYYGDASHVRTAVKRLRRKLAVACGDLSIESVRGVGFRLHVRQ